MLAMACTNHERLGKCAVEQPPPPQHPMIPPPSHVIDIETTTTTATNKQNHNGSTMIMTYTGATNDSLLQHFGVGTTLYSHYHRMEASAHEVLANKMVLIYFSSSWCGPCKRFTPRLLALYQRLKMQHQQDFEVVFCGMDTMPCMHDQYTSKMPWWCLPFQSTIVHKLSSVYNTSGIPHLVVLDRDGSMLHHDAVEQVMADPDGAHFPWRPKRFVDLLPEQYLRADGTTLASMRELDDKYLMIYASASWCPPCQRLTPKVAEIYRELKAQRDDVEFLYLSSDRDETEFNEFFATMGFAAIPYHERQAAADIAALLDIRCVPTLAMFGPRTEEGRCGRTLINANVRDIFQQQYAGSVVAQFPFAPLRFGDLNRVSEDINSTKCVVVFCETCDDEEQEEIIQALQVTAGAYVGCDDMRFYWASEATQLTKALRDMLNLGHPDGPNMILLDIPSGASYYEAPTPPDVTVDAIMHFVHHPGERKKL